jgi:hypothetical protein
MNSIKQVTSGLASSLFLAAGLTRLAEKTDPMANQVRNMVTPRQSAESCETCTWQCYFTPETGQ